MQSNRPHGEFVDPRQPVLAALPRREQWKKKVRQVILGTPYLAKAWPTLQSGYRILQAMYWRIRIIVFDMPTRGKKIDNYLATHSPAKVELGSSVISRKGWLGTDMEPRHENIFLDASKRFPFKDGSIDYIYGEHMIEHMSYAAALRLLQECLRVLKPGGRVRFATPNLEQVAALLAGSLSPQQEHFITSTNRRFVADPYNNRACFTINTMFYSHGHRFIYDPASLSDLLSRVGFCEIASYAVGESDDPELRDIEAHGLSVDVDTNAYQTMVYEAVKRTPMRAAA